MAHVDGTTVVDPLKIAAAWEALDKTVNRVDDCPSWCSDESDLIGDGDGSVWQPIFISCSCGESCLEGAFCRIS